jgi:5'-nucleotidase
VGLLRTRIVSSVAVLTLVAGSLVAGQIPASAADPIPLTFLNINDFHGRIDANTVKFAGTIEQERAAAGEANTLFLSAGDNIGASLFASSSAQDQPTIDVLNALELTASAVGNHEFDQGFADLTDRVIGDPPNAQWANLGANVYLRGTTTPALPEYEIVTVAGVSVGIIGALTQETPSLVSPGGISTLDFGDPVEAVNRVAAQLSDGDPANGEADVLIAEYHEGAGAGIPDGSTLEQEVAAGGAFAEIVTDTASQVDAIFTGHTHKQYAWDAPIPGATGTRPILQTGSYGENIGKIVLTYNPDTGAVDSYTAANIPRVTTDDLALVAAYPRVAQVKSITDAALAEAAEVGEKPVGSVTADITTAFLGGSYVNGVYVGPGPQPITGRDDRASESTLGNLVANSLVDSLGSQERGGAEIGVVNPGGLRADLFAAPDPVVTYAEANAVLPFVNNLWTTTLTGAQFKTLLEQQWQTNPDGTIPSRPYLQLGLSDNVSYTYDANAARGEHITSISIDGAPIDPMADYRIGTFSFLTSGGDNFRIFTEGTDARDSGLIDRDAWIDYLQENPGLAPDFARHAVGVAGAPTATVAGQPVSFTLSGLDLTSIGAPQNTSVTATLDDGTEIGTAPVTAGSATVQVTVPASTTPGPKIVTLTAVPSRTTVTLPLEVTTPAPVATVTLTPSAPSQVYGSKDRITLTAAVSASTGDKVRGRVQFVADGTVLATRPLINGVATYQLPARTPAGVISVTARYTGSGSLPAAESTPVEITVDKATAAAALLATKTSYRQGAFLPAILFGAVVLNNGQPARGSVDIVQDGTVIDTVPLRGGVFYYLLPRSLGKGAYTFKATYLPSDPANISGVDSNFISIQVR